MTNVAWFHTGQTAFQFEMLMATFVELRVLAGRSRTWAGRPQAVRETADVNSHMACLAPVVLCRGLGEVPFRTAWSEHGGGTELTWHGVCESNTAELCKSNWKEII